MEACMSGSLSDLLVCLTELLFHELLGALGEWLERSTVRCSISVWL